MMRWLVLLCLLPMSAGAKVAPYPLHWWPVEGQSLPPVPIIGINGYPEQLADLKTLKGIWLVSDTHRVPLTIMANNQGAGIEQLVWAPREPLRAGERYALEYRVGQRRIQAEWPSRFNQTGRKMSWVVAAKSETPKWLAQPEAIGTGSTGCISCGCWSSQKIRAHTLSARTLDVTVNGKPWIRPYRTGPINVGASIVEGPPGVHTEFNTVELAILDGWDRYPAPEAITVFVQPERRTQILSVRFRESSWTLVVLFSVLALFGVLGVRRLRRDGARSGSGSAA